MGVERPADQEAPEVEEDPEFLRELLSENAALLKGTSNSGGKKRQMRFSCSFCFNAQTEVKKLIGGPGVYICNECVELCNEIIAEPLQGESSPS